jgi:hypothetical protein
MKLNITNKMLKYKIVLCNDDTNCIFLSDSYEEFEKYDNTFYFKRLDTKNIYDPLYMIVIEK